MHGKQRLRQQPFPMRGGQARKARSASMNANQVRRYLALYREERGMMENFFPRMKLARQYLAA
jgi:hypothetical protein